MRIRMTGPLTSCEVVKQKVNTSRVRGSSEQLPLLWGEHRLLFLFARAFAGGELSSRGPAELPAFAGRRCREICSLGSLWPFSRFRQKCLSLRYWAEFSSARFGGPARGGRLGGDSGFAASIILFMKSWELGV